MSPVRAITSHTSAAASAATRYLCVAVHLESRLARAVIQQILEEPRLAVTRSPAVDAVTVCLHAVAASRRQVVRDAVLLGTLALAFYGVTSFPSGLPLVSLALIFAWAAVFTEAYAAYWGAIAYSLRAENFATASPPPAPNDRVRHQIAHVSAAATGNVTVYRGYNPFGGHGWIRGGWSLALDTTKPHQAGAPIVPFSAVELNARLSAELSALDIPDMTVENRLLVNGADVHTDRRFVPDPYGAPVPWTDQATLAALMTDPEDRARPYLTVEIVCWDGELVWSAFIRLVVNDTSLFVETNYTMLPPFRPYYYLIDDLLARPTGVQILRLAGRSAKRLPRAVLDCVPGISNHLLAGWRCWRKDRRDRRFIRELSRFHHGALFSPRESAANGDEKGVTYHRYFQSLDEQMVTKIVDKRIFNTLVDFLCDKNIDPAELKRRSEQIINNSLTIGSSVSVGGNLSMVHSALGGSHASNTMNASTFSGTSTP
ncbi:hypothetical protein VMT65_14165 [Nocardia sp. CDC153]|uniref:hypothetical protein n=1 Tax=Nocardia sp. CDC153 TaxID=3112167 RepID=UPI002DBD140D|nr:hypothetical protein [Nocardia sp. CDC153]MEC3954180.1 hypothetical protein [Nocardia sp. CDC153]